MKSQLLLTLLCLLLAFQPAIAQLNPDSVQVRVRDNKFIAVDVYTPDSITPRPTILIQTPYSRLPYRLWLPLGVGQNIKNSNYNFVIADWRCFYGSTAACTTGVTSEMRGRDGYDIVEWIAQQSWSDGQVGTWGPSALGKIQYYTAKQKPPSLVCAVPQVAAPQISYEETFPGGIIMEAHVAQLDKLGFGVSTTYYGNHVYNTLWQFAEPSSWYPQDFEVPMFLQAGWFDHATDAQFEIFDTMLKASPAKADHKMIIGPWVHGGTGSGYVGSKQAGEFEFPNAEGWADSTTMAFFDYHMRGLNNGWNNQPTYRYFQTQEGSWKGSNSWPPDSLEADTLFFNSFESLSRDRESLSNAATTFTYDPRDPSPTIGGRTLSDSLYQGPADQKAEVESRDDYAMFTTPEFTADLVIKDKPKFHLTVSSDKKDTDFMVRVTDVFPDGRSMIIWDGGFRMRFRDGFTAADTSVMNPGTQYEIDIPIQIMSYTFKEGHRLRVIVTSSNHNHYHSNINDGGPLYVDGDTLIAENTVHFGMGEDSYLSFNRLASNYLPSSIDERKSVVDAYIYPNPANNVLYLSSDITNYRIFNTLGILIASGSVTNGHIGLEGLSDGLFVIEMEDHDGQISSEKLTIAR